MTNWLKVMSRPKMVVGPTSYHNKKTVMGCMIWLAVLAGAALGCENKDSDKKEEVRPQSQGESDMEKEKPSGITIQYWGQSCLSVTDQNNLILLTDPFPASFGYAMPTVQPQICLVSHDHYDHNAVDTVKGDPQVIREGGQHEVKGITIKGVSTFHDSEGGKKRGNNLVFAWQMDGIHLAHLGDLGHVLTEQQVEQIGEVDVLMVPVGGFYTIDAAQAVQVAEQLKAKIVIPMHFKTSAISLPIAPVDEFLKSVPKEWQVKQPKSSSVTIAQSDLDTSQVSVVVLMP